MNRLVLMVIGLMVLVSAVSAQRTPKFSAFPAAIETAKAKTIDFKRNPDARTFKTLLSQGLRKGANFAGHYVVVGWGCGTGCISGAIVDARTGNVFWPEQFNALSVSFIGDDYVEKPVEYRTNSRLLVIRGIPGQAKDDAPEKPPGDYYYEWRNNRLRQVAFISRPTQ